MLPPFREPVHDSHLCIVSPGDVSLPGIIKSFSVRDFHTPFSGVFQKIAHVPLGVLKPFLGIF